MIFNRSFSVCDLSKMPREHWSGRLPRLLQERRDRTTYDAFFPERNRNHWGRRPSVSGLTLSFASKCHFREFWSIVFLPFRTLSFSCFMTKLRRQMVTPVTEPAGHTFTIRSQMLIWKLPNVRFVDHFLTLSQTYVLSCWSRQLALSIIRKYDWSVSRIRQSFKFIQNSSKIFW